MGQKRRKIFCVVLNYGEHFILPPPVPPAGTPNFSPPREPFLGVLQFLRHSSPHLWKKVGAHACPTHS